MQTLKFVDSNYSFHSPCDDPDRFRVMFPDSDIAENYHQIIAKIRYNIQFGITPFIKECLLYDVSNVPFSFKFDETTTSKVDKKYAYM